jgi:hypothetical protein
MATGTITGTDITITMTTVPTPTIIITITSFWGAASRSLTKNSGSGRCFFVHL